MVPKPGTRDRIAELAQAIERQIEQRTWGRIHRLQVELIDDRVVVHGYTQTHYVKQLALEGVRDVIGSSAHVELDVYVDSCCFSGGRGRNRTVGRRASTTE
jgi:hypothetical protein